MDSEITNKENEEFRCENRCREAKICQKCSPICRGQFRKVFDLEGTGLSVYVHLDENAMDEEMQKKRKILQKSKESFLIYNPTERPIDKTEFRQEINQFSSACKHCKSMLYQVRGLLDKAQGVVQDEVVTVCERCKSTSSHCKRCAQIINKFLLKRVKLFEERHEKVKDWLGDVKKLVTTILEKESVSKVREDSTVQELKKVLGEMRKPTTFREPEILHFPAADIEAMEMGEGLKENKALVEKIITILETDRPTARDKLERLIGEEDIKEMPDEILTSLGNITKDKLTSLLESNLTNKFVDQLLKNLGTLSLQKLNKAFGSDTANEMADKLLTNLEKLTRDKCDKLLGTKMTKEMLDRVFAQAGNKVTRNDVEKIFGVGVVKDVVDQIVKNFDNEKITTRKLEKVLGGSEAVHGLLNRALANMGRLTKDKLEKTVGSEFAKEIINKLLTNHGKPDQEKHELLYGSTLTNTVVEKVLGNFGQQLSKQNLETIVGPNIADEVLNKILSSLGREKLTRVQLEKLLGPSLATEILNKVLNKLQEAQLTKDKLYKLIGSDFPKNVIDKIMMGLEGEKFTINTLEKLMGPKGGTGVLDKILENIGKEKFVLKAMKGGSDESIKVMRSMFKGERKKSVAGKRKASVDEPSFILLPAPKSDSKQKLLEPKNVIFESPKAPVQPKPIEEKETQTEKGVVTPKIPKTTEQKPLAEMPAERDKTVEYAPEEETHETVQRPPPHPRPPPPPPRPIPPVPPREKTFIKEKKEEAKQKPKEEVKDQQPEPEKKETPKKSDHSFIYQKSKSREKMTQESKRIIVDKPVPKKESSKKLTSKASSVHVMRKKAGSIVIDVLHPKEDMFDITHMMPVEEKKEEVKKKLEARLFRLDAEGTDAKEVEIKEPEEVEKKKAKHPRKRDKTAKQPDPESEPKPKPSQHSTKVHSMKELKAKQSKAKASAIKLSHSTKLLIKMLKDKEIERRKMHEDRLKHEKTTSKIKQKVPIIKSLPDINKGKRLPKDLAGHDSSSTVECEFGPAVPKELIRGVEVIPFMKLRKENKNKEVPLLFKTEPICPPPKEKIQVDSEERIKMTLSQLLHASQTQHLQGIVKYSLSNPEFIKRGWTKLPTVRIMRRLNVYKMVPAYKNTNWFLRHEPFTTLKYDTGEKLAEIDLNGFGRWYYKNGILAMDFYKAEEPFAEGRYVLYSSGERDENGKRRLVTLLACFDQIGNGIVFDHCGKERLKYNQTEGEIYDAKIGPSGKWQWHGLNDPEAHKSVYMDNYVTRRDRELEDLMKLHEQSCLELQISERDVKGKSSKSREENAETVAARQKAYDQMLAIELENEVRQTSEKLLQRFKPYEIKPKFIKINEYFSLKILNQANITLSFHCGQTLLKQNIGMLLDDKEIVDSEAVDIGSVASPFDRVLPKSKSMEDLLQIVEDAKANSRQFEPLVY